MALEPAELRLDDERSVADLRTFVTRARVLVPDGYVRLQARGRSLQLTVLVRSGEGLLGAGTVTAMRGAPLAAEATSDVLVDLAAVSDRLARMADEGVTGLTLPPVTRSAAWAAVTPPRSGWEVVGDGDPAVLAGLASDLLAPMAELRDAGASEAEISAADKAAWQRNLGEGQQQFRAALVLGAHALGFLAGEQARVFRQGSWQRLTTAAGSVIAR